MARQRAGRGGRTYTPKSGPLAGRTFSSEWKYRQARAAQQGFPSVYQQRQGSEHPLMGQLKNILVDRADMDARDAREAAREFWSEETDHSRWKPPGTVPSGFGGRKYRLIKWLIDNNYVDPADRWDLVDELYY